MSPLVSDFPHFPQTAVPTGSSEHSFHTYPIRSPNDKVSENVIRKLRHGIHLPAGQLPGHACPCTHSAGTTVRLTARVRPARPGAWPLAPRGERRRCAPPPAAAGRPRDQERRPGHPRPRRRAVSRGHRRCRRGPGAGRRGRGGARGSQWARGPAADASAAPGARRLRAQSGRSEAGGERRAGSWARPCAARSGRGEARRRQPGRWPPSEPGASSGPGRARPRPCTPPRPATPPAAARAPRAGSAQAGAAAAARVAGRLPSRCSAGAPRSRAPPLSRSSSRGPRGCRSARTPPPAAAPRGKCPRPLGSGGRCGLQRRQVESNLATWRARGCRGKRGMGPRA